MKMLRILTLLALIAGVCAIVSCASPKSNVGDAGTQNHLGYMYATGNGASRDDQEAVRRFRQAAERGNAQARHNLGFMYFTGKGVSQDYQEAVKWWRLAAEQGHAPAQWNLGECYAAGKGVLQDDKEAMNWFRRAERPFAASLRNFPSLPQSPPEDAKVDECTKALASRLGGSHMLFLSSQDEGTGKLQYALGMMSANGECADRDDKEAAEWWRLAADRGNVNAKNSLRTALQTEAAKGDADAQNALQQIAAKEAAERAEQEKARQAATERAKAEAEQARQAETARQAEYQRQIQLAAEQEERAWQAEAARQSEYQRQTQLAAEQEERAREAEAARFSEQAEQIKLAAEQGDPNAQFNLGAMYANGWGVVENYVEGYAWTIIAAANGYNAEANKQWFQQRMNSSQIAAAQQRAQEIQAGLARKQRLAQTPADQVPAPDIVPSGSGSGLLLKGGYVVTCWHVVKDAKNIVVRAQQQDYAATVAASDANKDLAVLRLTGMNGGTSLHIATGTKLGEKVFTLGFPNTYMQGDEVKFNDGSVSSLSGPQNSPLFYQISVSVQPGNSGGPLFDGKGNLVGIVAAKLDTATALVVSGDLPQNVNYAIKAQYLLPLVETIPGFPSRALSAEATGLAGGFGGRVVIALANGTRLAEAG